MGENRTREIVEYANVKIEVIVEGTGPAIILLPSRGRDSEDFDAVAAHLAAARFRVLRPQPRGVGKSTGPMEGLTLHEFARDMAALIEKMGPSPAVILGHAFGNWIARMTAVDYPKLVRGVIIAAASAKGPAPKELRQALGKSQDMSLPVAERLQALQFGFFAPDHDPSIWLGGWQKAASAAQGIAIENTQEDEWWHAGTAPIFDLQAGLDPWRPRTTVNQLKDEFGARVTVGVILDASHALIPEQPNKIVTKILPWLRQLP